MTGDDVQALGLVKFLPNPHAFGGFRSEMGLGIPPWNCGRGSKRRWDSRKRVNSAKQRKGKRGQHLQRVSGCFSKQAGAGDAT